MAEIKDILSRLANIFSKVNLKYIIVGGIAVIHYGHIRTTQDIDIIIEADKSKIEPFMRLLKESNFDVMEEQFRLALEEGTNISVFDEKSLLRLDISFAARDRQKDLLTKSVVHKIMGNKLRIAPLEYVLIGKVLFIGDIDKITDSELLEFQDAVDFLTLFYANEGKIDINILKREAKKLGVDRTLKRLLEIKFRE